MMKLLYNLKAFEGDTASFTANKDVVYPKNTILYNTTTGASYRGDGTNKLSALDPLSTSTPTAWSSITSKPAKIGAGTTEEAARTAIGAAAANHVHAIVADVDSGLAAAANLQALAVALSARIKVLENAASGA